MTDLTYEPLLIPAPIAKGMIGVGNSKFYKLVNAGEITLVKSGKRSFVEYSTLKKFVARLREASQTS